MGTCSRKGASGDAIARRVCFARWRGRRPGHPEQHPRQSRANDERRHFTVAGLRAVDTTPVILYRYEVYIDWTTIAGGFGPCPPPEAMFSLALSPDAIASAEKHMRPATECKGCHLS